MHPSACKRGVQRGATPLAGGMEDVPPSLPHRHCEPPRSNLGWWCPARVPAGSPEGCNPSSPIIASRSEAIWGGGGALCGARLAPHPRLPRRKLLAMTAWRCGPALRRCGCSTGVPARSPEGRTPTGRRYGGCASIHDSSSLSPLPSRKGVRGMVPAPIETQPRMAGVQRGALPPLPSLRAAAKQSGVVVVPLARASGESSGVQPHWQAVWRMCLHTLHFFTFPPS